MLTGQADIAQSACGHKRDTKVNRRMKIRRYDPMREGQLLSPRSRRRGFGFLPFVLVVIVALLVLFWFRGGEQPLTTIEQPLPLNLTDQQG